MGTGIVPVVAPCYRKMSDFVPTSLAQNARFLICVQQELRGDSLRCNRFKGGLLGKVSAKDTVFPTFPSLETDGLGKPVV